MVCFVHFDLEMCFAPQRRALFQHLNFQKWSEHGVFCTFWLGNVLPATTACNFSSLIWPAGSAPAALASLLFDSPEPQIIGKTQCFATFLPFRASASSFFWLFLFYSSLIFLFSLPLPCSAFHLSILSEVWLLNFLRSVYRWCSPVCCFKNVEFPMSLSYVPEGINIEIQRLVGQKISKKRIRGWSVGCCWNMWKPQGNVEVYTIETWHEQAVNPGSQLFGGAWWLDWSPCWKYVMHTY